MEEEAPGVQYESVPFLATCWREKQSHLRPILFAVEAQVGRVAMEGRKICVPQLLCNAVRHYCDWLPVAGVGKVQINLARGGRHCLVYGVVESCESWVIYCVAMDSHLCCAFCGVNNA